MWQYSTAVDGSAGVHRTEHVKVWYWIGCIFATLVLVGCSSESAVNFGDANEVGGACTPAKLGVASYWANWVVKPNASVVIDHVALVPAGDVSDATLIGMFAETRHAGGVEGAPWDGGLVPGLAPRGHSFRDWVALRSPVHLRISAHQQVTFAAVIRFDGTTRAHWKGLRLYYNGTSHLVPFWLTVHPSRLPLKRNPGCDHDRGG